MVNSWNILYNKILKLYDVTIDGRIINKKTNQTLKRGRLRKGYKYTGEILLSLKNKRSKLKLYEISQSGKKKEVELYAYPKSCE